MKMIRRFLSLVFLLHVDYLKNQSFFLPLVAGLGLVVVSIVSGRLGHLMGFSGFGLFGASLLCFYFFWKEN